RLVHPRLARRGCVASRLRGAAGLTCGAGLGETMALTLRRRRDALEGGRRGLFGLGYSARRWVGQALELILPHAVLLIERWAVRVQALRGDSATPWGEAPRDVASKLPENSTAYPIQAASQQTRFGPGFDRGSAELANRCSTGRCFTMPPCSRRRSRCRLVHAAAFVHDAAHDAALFAMPRPNNSVSCEAVCAARSRPIPSACIWPS